MNKCKAINIICKNLCRFYKSGKDETLACRGFDLVLDLIEEKKINESWLTEITDFTISDYPFDEYLKKHLCKKCDFVINGCGFRDDSYHGEKKNPCGGYILLTKLLSKEVLAVKDIKKE